MIKNIHSKMNKILIIVMVIVLTALNVTATNSTLNDSLTSWYKFEGNFYDELNTYNWTDYGYENTTGLDGNAVYFNNTVFGSNYAIIDKYVLYKSPYDTYSVSAWVLLDDDTKNDRWYNFGSSTSGGSAGYNIGFRNETDNTTRLSQVKGGVVGLTGYNYDEYIIGAWYHIIVTGDNVGGMKNYINGVLVGENSDSNNIPAMSGLYYGLGCAVSGSSAWQCANTKIDELGIYNKALDDDSCSLNSTCGGEIAELYNNGDGFFYPFEPIEPQFFNITLNYPLNNTLLTDYNKSILINITHSENISSCISNNTLWNTTTINSIDDNNSIYNIYAPDFNLTLTANYSIFINCSDIETNIDSFNMELLYYYNVTVPPSEPEGNVTLEVIINQDDESNYIFYIFILWIGLVLFSLGLKDKIRMIMVFFVSFLGIMASIWIFKNVPEFPTIITTIFGFINVYILVAYMKNK